MVAQTTLSYMLTWVIKRLLLISVLCIQAENLYAELQDTQAALSILAANQMSTGLPF